MEGFINCVAMYLLVLFLLLMYASIAFGLAKKSGATKEDMIKNTKVWVALKKRAAREYFLSKEGMASVSMLFSVLVYFWITDHVGFWPPWVGALLFNPMHHMAFHLIFLVPASLALASKKSIGLLIAIPYLILLGFGLFELIVVSRDGVGNALVAHRILASLTIAWAVPAVIVVLLWNIDETRKKKIYLVAMVLQMAVSAGTVYYYTFHYGVWHLAGEPVSVQRLRLGDGEMGFPLVEEDAAYIVDRTGRLYQIKLAEGQRRLLARIPRPTAEEAGFPGLALVPVTRDAASPFLLGGVLKRVNSDELAYHYEYIGTTDGTFTLEVKINQNSGQVSWQLSERKPTIPFPPPVYAATMAQGKIISVATDLGFSPFTVLIEGEGIKTAIDPMGWVNWAQAKHGWILVGTNRGWLLIITTNGR
ncbi:MAG: hypothetical protein KGZ53_10960 [Peptococcaceae bacterium]|nr:hypothetical protein [Peptococcaceae bacterium]